MQKLTYAVALLIGAASSINVNTRFAEGVHGDEDLSQEIMELKKRQAEPTPEEDSAFIQLPEHTIAFA